MIVKNESTVIVRCLKSVEPLIDYWVIVDTGSTDGTQQLIKETLKEIPGELHESPWINFEHNRNEALSLARGKADYLLFIDADEVLSYAPDFAFGNLDKDFYHIMCDYSGLKYARLNMVSSQLDCSWVGVVHEIIDISKARSSGVIEGLKNIVYPEGSRSTDPLKYHKDAQILEAALKENPFNKRYVFYLAQSYRDSEQNELALSNYEKRVAMGGWDQEIFWSLLQTGILREKLEKPIAEIIDSYLKAYLMRPKRAEPLYRLANLYRRNEDYFAGYLAAKQGLTIPLSDDTLFVESWVYDYGLLLEYAICASGIENFQESLLAFYLLVGKKELPQNVRQCVFKNIAWIEQKIKPQIPIDLPTEICILPSANENIKN